MATAVLRPPTLTAFQSPAPLSYSSKCQKLSCVSFKHRQPCRARRHVIHTQFISNRLLGPPLLDNIFPFASHGEVTETETASNQDDQIQEPEQHQENSDGAVGIEIEAESPDTSEPSSSIITLLQSYKEALESNDESKIAVMESFFKSIEDEKNDLDRKMISLSEVLSHEKDRILRISADFDNFRKRTERERLSLVTNAQGEMVENLLPILDNFERAKAQIKVETEGEGKINNSYQSIYKQFVEILESFGVAPVETIGNPFDPELHEAIMREESTELEEGIILEEYRKGFKLGDRLLRPSMVKVSAGPGPAKPESLEPTGETEDGSESMGGSSETEPAGAADN